MEIFSRNQGENHNNITSVVLIEQTQKYRNKTSWGLSFSNSPFGDPIAMSQTVPDDDIKTLLYMSYQATSPKMKRRNEEQKQ